MRVEYFDTQIRPVSQLSAYYDSFGYGLYLAMLDDTGDATKSFRYGASPDRTAFRYEAVSFGADLTDPSRPLDCVPLAVGRFYGDWWDAALQYRDWLSGTTIASSGPVAARADVAEFMKRYQHVGVLSPMESYLPGCGGTGGLATIDLGLGADSLAVMHSVKLDCTAYPALQAAMAGLTVPERLAQYRDHWGLQDMSVLQFSPVWPACGEDGVGAYQIAPKWVQHAALMGAAGLNYWLYLFDAWYRTELNNPCDQSFATEGWLARTVLQIDGTHQTFTTGSGPDLKQFAMIDPSTSEWLSRMGQVGFWLGLSGVDGVYLDNFFPDPTSASFTSDQGHLPGFGPYLTRGFADSMSLLRSQAAWFGAFSTYSEVNFESFLRSSDMMGPLQQAADLLTGTADAELVPLHAVLYHHLAILGPCTAGYYTRPPVLPAPPGCGCNGMGGDLLTTFSCDPAEREKARRGAAYTLAFGWANGSAIWSPDFAVTSPNCYLFSFELPDDGTGCTDEYEAVCAYAASLSSLRGAGFLQPFLNVGRRMRDFAWIAPPPAIEVALTPVLPGQSDVELVPAVVQAVWRDELSKDFGLAVANHSGQSVEGLSVLVNPAQVDDSPAAAYRVALVETNAIAILGTITGRGPTPWVLPNLPPESAVFLRFSPAEPGPGPAPGGAGEGPAVQVKQ